MYIFIFIQIAQSGDQMFDINEDIPHDVIAMALRPTLSEVHTHITPTLIGDARDDFWITLYNYM